MGPTFWIIVVLAASISSFFLGKLVERNKTPAKLIEDTYVDRFLIEGDKDTVANGIVSALNSISFGHTFKISYVADYIEGAVYKSHYNLNGEISGTPSQISDSLLLAIGDKVVKFKSDIYVRKVNLSVDNSDNTRPLPREDVEEKIRAAVEVQLALHNISK